jgi:hypothetical protein
MQPGYSVPMQRTDKLDRIIKRESTHLQWNKIILNWLMFFCLVVVTLLRKKKFKRCSNSDWGCLLGLIIFAALNTMLGIRNIKKEYEEKVEANYQFS